MTLCACVVCVCVCVPYRDSTLMVEGMGEKLGQTVCVPQLCACGVPVCLPVRALVRVYALCCPLDVSMFTCRRGYVSLPLLPVVPPRSMR